MKRSTTPKKADDIVAATADQSSRQMTVTMPRDKAGRRRQAKSIYLRTIGASILESQMSPMVTDNGAQAALVFVEAMMESIRPRNAIEEMLVLQMAWTHARLGNLSSLAGRQASVEAAKMIHEAADRAANTFRRQMLALADYRRPARSDAFVAIKQANVAQQQVVQNVENPNFQTIATSGVDAGAAGPVAATRSARQALAIQHRPKDGGGQGKDKDERMEAWPAERGDAGDVEAAE
ncbi:MAG: hypothetical protein IT446_02445 [Phycisphaerales bacterium]|nr:hypothetical protein [Phycisphaerales bacterium]